MALDIFLIRKVLLWLKPVSSKAKTLGSELLLSRQVFSAQNGARKKLRICPEPLGNKRSEYVF
jgi:hypothetical protein